MTECGLDYDRSLDLSAFVRDGRLRWLAPEGRWTVAEINRSALYEGYQAGTDRGGGYAPRYPSLLLEDVTRRFIETTHRRYASAFDEPLGELFTSTFTDEPSLMAQPYQNPGYGVYPWKENVSAEFRSRYGLSLEDGLLRLMLDEGPGRAEAPLSLFPGCYRSADPQLFRTDTRLLPYAEASLGRTSVARGVHDGPRAALR